MNAFCLGYKHIWICFFAFLLVVIPATAWSVSVPPASAGSVANSCKGRHCETCEIPTPPPTCAAGSFISYTEGNMGDSVPVLTLANTLNLDLTYNSFNADASNFRVNTVLGFGWTHSYNLFITEYRFDAFLQRGNGVTTKFKRFPGGTYVPVDGWFDTLTKPNAKTYLMTTKDGTQYRFELLTPAPFLMPGPPYYLKSITDRNGRITRLAYNANGLLTSITDPFERVVTFTYNANKKIKTITDPLGRITSLAYGPNSYDLIRITDPVANTIEYRYNANHQLNRKRDKDGRVFTYLYDGSGKPVGVKDESGATVLNLTNPNEWAVNSGVMLTELRRLYVSGTTTKVDGRGNRWTYAYDQFGNVTKVIAPDGATTTYTYDPVTLKLASMTDDNGYTTQYQYDPIGNLIKQIDANGNETRYEYNNPFNFVTQMSSFASGSTTPYSVTTYDYDAQGNRIRETRDVGGLNLMTEWEYYSAGLPEPGNPSGKQGLMKTQIDPNGHPTAYKYDVNGNLNEVIDPLGNTTVYEYDIVGNKTKMIDANGHVWLYDPYDGMNRLLAETDPLGFKTEYSYDGLGNRTELRKQVTKTPLIFQKTRYEYDLRNRLIKEIRDPDGLNLITQYAYDGNDNRVEMVDPRLKKTSYTYDEQNRLSRVTDALANVTETRYDGVGNRICVIDANQHYTFFDYDALNRQTKESKKIGTQECTTGDADDIITETFYDVGTPIPPIHCLALQCEKPTPGSSNVTQMIDPEGKVTYFKFDHDDRRVMTVRKVGDTDDDFDKTGNLAEDDWSEIVQYDAAGNVLARIDANGNPTTFTYFDNNWLKSEANALNETTANTYDGVGNIKTILSPGGNHTTNTYNDRNELIQVSDSEGPVAGSDPVGKPGYLYDGVGNRIRECDGNDHCSEYAYDAVNRLISVTDALGETSHYEYDTAGNLIKTLDREAHAMCYVPDDINRRIRSIQKVGDTDCNVIDGDDVWTKTVYDAVGNVTELTTAKQIDGGTPPTCNSLSPPEDCETTRYVYDEVNRLVQEAYPLRQAGDTAKNTREFSYDKASNLKKRIDQKNQATDYVYNDLYYLTLRDYQIDADDRFAYDVGGRMLRAGRAGWIVTFDYDDANRVLHSTQNGKPVDYVYDTANRRRTLTYPSNKVVTEDRDFRERLAEIDGGTIAAYQYDFGNRVLTRSYGNGTAANYAYNDNNWITKLEHTKAGPALIAGFGHDYDREGNKRFEEKQHDPGNSEGYEYDDLYRLIHYKVGALDAAGTVQMPVTQTQYCLDKLGNWDCKEHTQGGITTMENRQHNAVNEITQIDAVPLSYDDNGNLIQDERYSYEFDQENRLTRVSFIGISGLETAGEYRYDALSRRIVKKTGLNRGNKETHYFYDDARIIEEQSAAGSTEANYVYGNYIDEVLTMDRALQTYYYHQNAMWSVAAITDGAANVVERVAYDAYGHPTITDALGNVLTNSWGTAHSVIGNPWMFTGRQYDEETGLYYYRARYYDPDKGRFLQRDALGYRDTLSLYEFVSSNPAIYVDPFGKAKYYCCKEWKSGWELEGYDDYESCVAELLGQTFWNEKAEYYVRPESSVHGGALGAATAIEATETLVTKSAEKLSSAAGGYSKAATVAQSAGHPIKAQLMQLRAGKALSQAKQLKTFVKPRALKPNILSKGPRIGGAAALGAIVWEGGNIVAGLYVEKLALETCTDEYCVKGHMPKVTVECKGRIWDTCKETCNQGEEIFEFGKTKGVLEQLPNEKTYWARNCFE